MWDRLIEPLSRHCRLIVPDARGHGDSGPTSDASVDRWVEDLRLVLEQVEADDVVLVGVSVGGIQALAYAAAFPDRVRGLVVADSFAGLDPEVARRKIALLSDQARSRPMAEVADQYVADTFQTPVPSGAEVVRCAIAGMDPDSYLAAVEACFSADIVGRLPEVKMPTRVLWGELDAKTPRVLSEQIADGVQDGHLRVIPDAGHLSNVENPAGFLDEIVTFFPPSSSHVRAVDEGAI
jgi:pimeloyl-ACP methyl ester carboxylesterase